MISLNSKLVSRPRKPVGSIIFNCAGRPVSVARVVGMAIRGLCEAGSGSAPNAPMILGDGRDNLSGHPYVAAVVVPRDVVGDDSEECRQRFGTAASVRLAPA